MLIGIASLSHVCTRRSSPSMLHFGKKTARKSLWRPRCSASRPREACRNRWSEGCGVASPTGAEPCLVPKLREMGGAPRNPAARNHILVRIVKPSGCHCTDAFGGQTHRRVPTPLRSTSPFSERWRRVISSTPWTSDLGGGGAFSACRRRQQQQSAQPVTQERHLERRAQNLRALDC